MNQRNIVNDTQEINVAGIIVASDKGAWCNGIEFYNSGTVIAYVNNRPIPVGASWSPPCDVGDKDISQYRLNFAGGGNGAVLVTRKLYT